MSSWLCEYLALGMASEALRTLSPITGSDSRSCNPTHGAGRRTVGLDEGRATAVLPASVPEPFYRRSTVMVHSTDPILYHGSPI
jgi:hypothetical protein